MTGRYALHGGASAMALWLALATAATVQAQPDAAAPDPHPVLRAPALTPPLPDPELPPPPPDQSEPPILQGVHRGEPLVPASQEPPQGTALHEPPRDPPGTAGDIGRVSMLELPREESMPEPPLFSLHGGVGFTVAFSMTQLYFARLEQRFEARIPQAEFFRVGASIAQMVADVAYIEAAPTFGMGTTMCRASWVECEIVIFVQPGIAAGFFGTQFSFAASADLRFHFDPHFSLAIAGGFSRIGEVSTLNTRALAAAHF